MPTLPKFVEWELTGACDLRCAHCHRGCGRAYPTPSGEGVLAIADALIDAGVQAVAVSGGEPTLSPHLWPAIKRLKAGGAFVSLITNGRDDSGDFALRCRDHGLDFVWLSLDGPEAVHDAVRGRDGVFSRLMRASGHLGRHGARFGFMTTLLRANRGHLDAIHELVRAAGADLWQLQLGLPNSAEPELFLTTDELVALQPALARLRAGEPRLLLGEALALTLGEPTWIHGAGDRAPSPLSGCPSGRGGFVVAPDGRLRGCSCLPDTGAGPRLTEESDLAASAAELSHEARERERALAPAALALRGELHPGGFCHALALRHARFVEPASAVPGAGPTAHSTTATTAATAAVAAIFSTLLACSSSKAPAEDKTTPPEAGPPVSMTPAENTPPPAEPEVPPPAEPMATTDATPAGMAPGQSTTNVVAPAADAPGMKPADWKMPKCCMMHVLVPDCVCSPPPGTIPVP